jgi:hypothetical protein
MITVNDAKMASRVTRAKSALGRGIKYELGRGGFDPSASSPADSRNRSDCSGFALAWAFNLNRRPKKSRDWWLSTSDVYADAMSKKPSVFMRLKKPVIGCAVLYPDRNGEQGHTAIITAFKLNWLGRVVKLWGIDCSSSQSRKTGDAITERDLTFFMAEKPIFVILIEDLA